MFLLHKLISVIHIVTWEYMWRKPRAMIILYSDLRVLRSAHTRGLVPATSPCNKSRGQVPSCELAIFDKKSSRGDQNLVPATCPTNSNWFEFVGLVPATSPWKPFVWTVRETSPCDQIKINQSQIGVISSHKSLRTLFKDGGGSRRRCWCLEILMEYSPRFASVLVYPDR